MKRCKTFSVTVCILYLLAACASVPRTYNSLSDWDTSQDNQIERKEFVDAYVSQNYFKKWSRGGGSITYQKLFNEAFASMDGDKDASLGVDEFSSQIKLFYFGLFSETFGQWDDDGNATISKGEFDKHVSTTNLASIWDTNDDKRIAEREMAGGMFYICDANSDGHVDETELNNWKRNR